MPRSCEHSRSTRAHKGERLNDWHDLHVESFDSYLHWSNSGTHSRVERPEFYGMVGQGIGAIHCCLPSLTTYRADTTNVSGKIASATPLQSVWCDTYGWFHVL